jgi:hypothetical protein
VSGPLGVGSPAPGFVLPGLVGTVDSSTLRGASYVVEFLRGTW